MSTRRITTGKVGRNVLGSIVAEDNSLQSVITNANIILDPNGTGIVESTTDIRLNAAKSLRFADSDSSNFVAVKSPATVASNITYTLPGTITANFYLTTDSNGNLSWANATVNISNQTTDTATYYPMITTSTTGTVNTVNTSTTKLSFQPSTGTLTATAFSGTSSTLSGTLTAASIVETSSIAYKENVEPITNALEKVMQLVGVTYDRKDGSRYNEAGLIKEDVEKVLPNLVTDDGIHYTKLTAYLIEAVKELTKEIVTLKGNK